MPTYEYECTKCGYRFEINQRITDNPLTTCPKCKGKLIKLIPKNTTFFINEHRKLTRRDVKEMERTWKGKPRI